MTGWLAWYWRDVGSNILAMPLELFTGFAFGVAFAKPAKKWWHKHFGVKAELEDVKVMLREASEAACAARHIASDLFTHHTGTEHVRAPVIPPVD